MGFRPSNRNSYARNDLKYTRDEPEAGHVRSGPAGPDVRVRSGPADFQPDLSRIFKYFFTHFNTFLRCLRYLSMVYFLKSYIWACR